RLLPAIMGGIYSSTATTVALARRLGRARTARADLSAGIIAATSMMYARVLVIIALFNASLAFTLAPYFGTLLAAGAAASLLEWKRFLDSDGDEASDLEATNPLELPMALFFAAAFFLISVVTGWAQSQFGP